MSGPLKDYEDITDFGLDKADENALIADVNECSFVWLTRDGSPMAVTMSYLRDADGTFWLTASSQRKRVPAVRRDSRVCVVVNSPGPPGGGSGRTVTYKGTATVHNDADTKSWFYPAFAERLRGMHGAAVVREHIAMLDTPRRVIISVAPTTRVSYDGRKLRRSLDQARATGALDEL
jgi:general stress protein 26